MTFQININHLASSYSKHLDTPDVVNLMRCSKTFYQAFKSDVVWLPIARALCLKRGENKSFYQTVKEFYELFIQHTQRYLVKPKPPKGFARMIKWIQHKKKAQYQKNEENKKKATYLINEEKWKDPQIQNNLNPNLNGYVHPRVAFHLKKLNPLIQCEDLDETLMNHGEWLMLLDRIHSDPNLDMTKLFHCLADYLKSHQQSSWRKIDITTGRKVSEIPENVAKELFQPCRISDKAQPGTITEYKWLSTIEAAAKYCDIPLLKALLQMRPISSLVLYQNAQSPIATILLLAGAKVKDEKAWIEIAQSLLENSRFKNDDTYFNIIQALFQYCSQDAVQIRQDQNGVTQIHFKEINQSFSLSQELKGKLYEFIPQWRRNENWDEILEQLSHDQNLE